MLTVFFVELSNTNASLDRGSSDIISSIAAGVGLYWNVPRDRELTVPSVLVIIVIYTFLGYVFM